MSLSIWRCTSQERRLIATSLRESTTEWKVVHICMLCIGWELKESIHSLKGFVRFVVRRFLWSGVSEWWQGSRIVLLLWWGLFLVDKRSAFLLDLFEYQNIARVTISGGRKERNGGFGHVSMCGLQVAEAEMYPRVCVCAILPSRWASKIR